MRFICSYLTPSLPPAKGQILFWLNSRTGLRDSYDVMYSHKKSRWRNQICQTCQRHSKVLTWMMIVLWRAILRRDSGTEEELGSHPYMFEPETTNITTIQIPWNRQTLVWAVSIGKTNLGFSLSLRWRYIFSFIMQVY